MGSTDAPAPSRNPFKFTHPANALDRDRIVIPAGWDSWGKIKILRDDFEPSKWSEGWEKDMESFSFAPPNSTTSTNGVGTSATRTTEARLGLAVSNGARSLFKMLVGPDRGPPLESLPAIIQPTPEQTFLQQHYETLAKDPGRDPRATFRQPAVAVDGAAISSSAGGAGGVGVGVVGPLGSSSFSLPSVEKALIEMEGRSERDKEGDRSIDKDRDRLGMSRTTAGVAGRRVSQILRSWKFSYCFQGWSINI
jgi:dynein light intermediate chain 1, cytosolic